VVPIVASAREPTSRQLEPGGRIDELLRMVEHFLRLVRLALDADPYRRP
jgi:hypothetical protein